MTFIGLAPEKKRSEIVFNKVRKEVGGYQSWWVTRHEGKQQPFFWTLSLS
jgi:hypothetical protein